MKSGDEVQPNNQSVGEVAYALTEDEKLLRSKFHQERNDASLLLLLQLHSADLVNDSLDGKPYSEAEIEEELLQLERRLLGKFLNLDGTPFTQLQHEDLLRQQKSYDEMDVEQWERIRKQNLLTPRIASDHLKLAEIYQDVVEVMMNIDPNYWDIILNNSDVDYIFNKLTSKLVRLKKYEEAYRYLNLYFAKGCNRFSDQKGDFFRILKRRERMAKLLIKPG